MKSFFALILLTGANLLMVSPAMAQAPCDPKITKEWYVTGIMTPVIDENTLDEFNTAVTELDLQEGSGLTIQGHFWGAYEIEEKQLQGISYLVQPIRITGKNYVASLQAAGVKHKLNLSLHREYLSACK